MVSSFANWGLQLHPSSRVLVHFPWGNACCTSSLLVLSLSPPNLVAWKNTNWSSQHFCSPEGWNGSCWLKSRYQQGYVSSRTPIGESVSFPFPASGGRLHSPARGLFHHLWNQQWTSWALCHIVSVVSLLLTLLPPVSAFKDPHDYIGPTRVICTNLLILKSAD